MAALSVMSVDASSTTGERRWRDESQLRYLPFPPIALDCGHNMPNLFIGACWGVILGSVLSIPLIVWQEQIFDAIDSVISHWRDVLRAESVDYSSQVQIIPTDSTVAAFVRLSEAFKGFGVSAVQAAQAFSNLKSVCDPLWTVYPGQWPDNFILLNRYLRTGVKPPFLV